MRSFRNIVLLLLVSGGVTSASPSERSSEGEQDTLSEDLLSTGAVPRVEKSAFQHVQDNLNDYSNDFGRGLEDLAMGMVRLRFDVQERKARFHLGGGDETKLHFSLGSNIHFQGSRARVQTHLSLQVAGKGVELDLPEFELQTESVRGQRAVQVQVPILFGRF